MEATGTTSGSAHVFRSLVLVLFGIGLCVCVCVRARGSENSIKRELVWRSKPVKPLPVNTACHKCEHQQQLVGGWLEILPSSSSSSSSRPQGPSCLQLRKCYNLSVTRYIHRRPLELCLLAVLYCLLVTTFICFAHYARHLRKSGSLGHDH